jgi:hypothetical protein
VLDFLNGEVRSRFKNYKFNLIVTSMTYPENLGVISCNCVTLHKKPVLYVSHAGEEWQMYCHWKNHDFSDSAVLKNELHLIHVTHLVSRDPSLNDVSDLPVDMGADRDSISSPWVRFEDGDDV